MVSQIFFRCLIFNCYNISICKKEKLKDETAKKNCEINRGQIREEVVPIWDSDRTLSVNLIGTLKNWSEYYKMLYASPSISVESYLFPLLVIIQISIKI